MACRNAKRQDSCTNVQFFSYPKGESAYKYADRKVFDIAHAGTYLPWVESMFR